MNSSLIILSQSMQAFAFGAVALFLPLIREDLDLTFSQAGTLAATTTIVYALMQVPSGFLADRYDSKRLFVIGLVGVNVLSLSFAVMDQYWMLLVNQGLSGFFRSLVFAPGLVLISRQFRPDRRATAMGLYVAGGFSSNIFLNALGPVLVGPLGWRGLFIVFSVSGLLVIGLFARFGDTARPSGDSAPDLSKLKVIVGHPVMLLCGVIQFVRLAVVMGVAFWLPTLITEDKGFSLATAGAVVAIGAAVTAPSNFFGGFISDRVNRPLAVIGVSLAMLAITLALVPVVDSLWLLIAVIAVNSVFVQLYFGPLFAVPMRYLGAENAGLVSGFGNFCANLGAFAFTYGIGAVKDATGSFDLAIYTLALLCCVGLVAVWAISRIPDPEADAEMVGPREDPLLAAEDPAIKVVP